MVGRKLEPVAIGRLERFIGDSARPHKAEAARFERCLGKVAVVGSGPSGLAVAADLARFGCDVTVYEALHVVGGVLQYGIPSFRLPREIISRETLTERGAIAGGVRAVDVQVTRLRRKVEPDPKLPRYLQTVRGRGYVLRPD